MEAIIAVAILGMAMVPLLALQVQTTQGTLALERTVDMGIARDVALSYLRLVDPVKEPEGELDIGGGWKMRWKTATLRPERLAIAGRVDPGRFVIARVRISADLLNENGRTARVEAISAGIREIAPYSPF